MFDCGRQEALLEVLLEPGGASGDRRELLDHARTCPPCGELRALHEDLEGMEVPAAGEESMLQMRREVLRTLRREKVEGARSHGLGRLIAQPVFAVLAGLALLAGGYVAGRVGSIDAGPGESDFESAVVRQLAGIEAADEMPLSWSNLRLDKAGERDVRVRFDATTKVDVVRSKDDPLVVDLVARALLDRRSIGTKLEAIQIAERPAPAVKTALVAAMLQDDNLAVRLKALSQLTTGGGGDRTDEIVKRALLDVLRNEASVQMRLLAVDYLTGAGIAPDELREALTAGRPEPGTAVRAKAERYLLTF